LNSAVPDQILPEFSREPAAPIPRPPGAREDRSLAEIADVQIYLAAVIRNPSFGVSLSVIFHGNARVSTEDQNPALQLAALKTLRLPAGSRRSASKPAHTQL
jgi:hypothetical protein